MTVRKTVTAAVATMALALSSGAAIAKPVNASTGAVRAATPVKNAEKANKGSGWIVGVIGMAAIIGGGIVLAASKDNHPPHSP